MTLYTNGTKDCNDLELVLLQNKIEFTVNQNLEEMKDKGILSLPCLEVNGKLLNYCCAMEYIRGLNRG